MRSSFAGQMLLLCYALIIADASFAQGRATPCHAWGISASLDMPYDHRGSFKYMGSGYSAGVDIMIPFRNPKWSLTYGLHFTARLRTTYFDKDYYDNEWMFNRLIDAPGRYPKPVESWSKSYSYATDVPFQVLYQAGNGKWKLIAGGGMSLGVLLARGYAHEVRYADNAWLGYNKTWESVPRNYVQCSPIATAGMQYQTAAKCFIRMQLTYRTFFNLEESWENPERFSYVLSRNQYAGVNAGIFRNF